MEFSQQINSNDGVFTTNKLQRWSFYKNKSSLTMEILQKINVNDAVFIKKIKT
jgi:hypothetical protein